MTKAPQVFGPRRHDLPETARYAIQHQGGAGADRISRLQQVLRGNAFEQHRGGLFSRQRVGNRHQPFGRKQARTGVSADRPCCVGHPITHLDVAHIRADGGNPASAFKAQTRWQWQRYGALALTHIEEVDANRLLLQPDFTRPRLTRRHLLDGHHLRCAGVCDTNDRNHCLTPSLQRSPSAPCAGSIDIRFHVNNTASLQFITACSAAV